MCCSTTCKVWAVVITIVALVMALVVTIWQQAALQYVIVVSRFFDIMLPILAVGALIKYIFSHCYVTKKEE